MPKPQPVFPVRLNADPDYKDNPELVTIVVYLMTSIANLVNVAQTQSPRPLATDRIGSDLITALILPDAPDSQKFGQMIKAFARNEIHTLLINSLGLRIQFDVRQWARLRTIPREDWGNEKPPLTIAAPDQLVRTHYSEYLKAVSAFCPESE